MISYRKRGRSIRREGAYRLIVDEAGEALQDDRGVFRARPLDEELALPAPDSDAVDAMAREIDAIVEAPLSIERVIISEGVVEHEIGEVRWRENVRRIHLSITHAPMRVLINLAEFRTTAIRRTAEALARAGRERRAPKRLRLSDAVGAALLPLLDIAKVQGPALHDGNGQPIDERAVEGPPPNWFRPSYRIPPRREWFHLRAVPFGAIDPGVPVAVALLASPAGGRVRVLCVDRGAAYPAIVELGHVTAARPTATWYPYGAGAFGAEIML